MEASLREPSQSSGAYSFSGPDSQTRDEQLSGQGGTETPSSGDELGASVAKGGPRGQGDGVGSRGTAPDEQGTGSPQRQSVTDSPDLESKLGASAVSGSGGTNGAGSWGKGDMRGMGSHPGRGLKDPPSPGSELMVFPDKGARGTNGASSPKRKGKRLGKGSPTEIEEEREERPALGPGGTNPCRSNPCKTEMNIETSGTAGQERPDSPSMDELRQNNEEGASEEGGESWLDRDSLVDGKVGIPKIDALLGGKAVFVGGFDGSESGFFSSTCSHCQRNWQIPQGAKGCNTFLCPGCDEFFEPVEDRKAAAFWGRHDPQTGAEGHPVGVRLSESESPWGVPKIKGDEKGAEHMGSGADESASVGSRVDAGPVRRPRSQPQPVQEEAVPAVVHNPVASGRQRRVSGIHLTRESSLACKESSQLSKCSFKARHVKHLSSSISVDLKRVSRTPNFRAFPLMSDQLPS